MRQLWKRREKMFYAVRSNNLTTAGHNNQFKGLNQTDASRGNVKSFFRVADSDFSRFNR